MRYAQTLTAALCLGCLATVLSAQPERGRPQPETQDKPRLVLLEQARQSLQLAKLAADNNLTDLSLKAVREALSSGPPMSALNIDASAGTGISTSTLTIGSSNPQEYDQIVAEIYQAVTGLVQIWKEKQVDPARTYETLRDVVIPPGRPKEIFLYAPPLKGNNQSLPETHHLGRLLIDYAREAGQVEDLQKQIAGRMESPRARVPGHVISCELALQNSDETEIRQLLDNLPTVIQEAHDSNERELLNHFVLRVIAIPAARKAAIPLYEQIIEQYPPSTKMENGRLEPISSLLISAAKLRSEEGDAAKAREHIERFLSVNEINNRRYDGDYAIQLARGQIELAALFFFDGNMLDDAVVKFREAMLLDVGAGRSMPAHSHHLFVRLLKYLQKTPAEKRYEILHEMVVPEAGSGDVLLTVATISDLKTPKLFQKVLPGQQEQSLNLPGYGPPGLLQSPGTLLVNTAIELNRLDELMKEIKPIYEADQVNARTLWALCLIARKDEQLASLLEKRAQTYRDAVSESKRLVDDDVWKDILLTCGALELPQAIGANRGLIDALTEYCKANQLWPLLARLRVIQADAIARSWEGAIPRTFAHAKPALWDSVSEVTASEHLQGGGNSFWFVQQGHLQHLGGGHESGLYFRYPLTGNLTIEAETYDAGWSESEVAYGGIVHKFQCWSTMGELYANGGYGRLRCPNLFINREDHGVFLHHTFEITPEATVHKINGHPVHTDPAASESPWLGFRAAPHSKAVIKRVRIQGDPVIPREVRLSDSPLMRGWLTGFYNESRPPALYASSDLAEDILLRQAASSNWEWRWDSGEIVGKKLTSDSQLPSAIESRICYERPLFRGDRLDWEFFYKPGEELVHPALGRLTFLLRPTGIKLHWMTDGPQDPSSLPSGHELDDAEGRRGPDTLPLQEGWNRMQLTLDRNRVRLSLNGTEVYERFLNADSDTGFSFFHFKDRTTARVRNVVLSGDWPESLSAELREALIPEQPNDLSSIDHYALATTIGRQPFYYDTLDRYLEALELPDEQRYQFLQEWVIPEPVQPDWRVEAEFTPTNQPPPIQQKFALISRLSPAQQQLDPATGGILVSPAVELVATAQRLNRLPALRQRIESQWANPESIVSMRSKRVLLLLCDLAAGNYQVANQSLLELETTLPEVKATQHFERWPSIVAASQAMLYDETRNSATSLLKAIVSTQIRKGQGDSWMWNDHIVGLWGLAEFLSFASGSDASYGTSPDLAQWTPASHTRGEVLEYGMPAAQWARSDNAATHMVGHYKDYLYFQSPLLGDFTLEAYLTSFGWREITPLYGNRWITLNYQKDRFEHGRLNESGETVTFDPPFQNVEDGYRVKLVVKDNRFSYFMNDRKIHEGEYDPVRDPWLAVQSPGSNHGTIRDLKITGMPEIPEEIVLSGNPDLTGWLGVFYNESMSGEQSNWFKRNEEIVGRLIPDRKGLFDESLLQYHRPLPRECELSYEFTYTPDSQAVHPAVGQLAFLLEPEGVRVHWLSHGRFNRFGLDPAASSEEPEHQKHSGTLPLKPGALNSMTVVLKGDQVQLVLNDQLIFERDLDAGNNHLFGLFHYKGQTEASVRNVRLKGNWPRELPSVPQQELASSRILDRNRSVERFTDRYEIDFRREQPDDKRFYLGSPEQVQSLPEGLKISSPGQDKWSETQVRAKCTLQGDFDVSLSFRDLALQSPGDMYQAMTTLFLTFANPDEGIRTGFTIDREGREFLGSVYTFKNAEGNAVYRSQRDEIPSGSGTYRMVREGATVHFLFAPEGSERFQKLFTQIVHDQEIPTGGLRIRVVAGQKGTETSMVATELKIAADKIIWAK